MSSLVREISDSDADNDAAQRVLRLAEKAKEAGDYIKAGVLVEAAYALFDESYEAAPAERLALPKKSAKFPFST